MPFFFSINRHAREAEEGFQGLESEGIKRKKKKKEEETMPRCYRITTAIIPYFVSYSAFFMRPSVIFIFEF